jgi:rhodanese-related sulfurtransferase
LKPIPARYESCRPNSDAKGIKMSEAVLDLPSFSVPAAIFGEDGFASVASPALEQARQQAVADQLPYAGSVSPQVAWALFSRGEAVIVDVRTAEERKFVGHVPETKHVAWMTGLSLSRNPRFVKELEAKAGKEEVILLLCRSGKRSAAAAEAAAKAGFKHVFNILEGFEGDLDEQQQRGAFNGWRNAGLPWIQD